MAVDTVLQTATVAYFGCYLTSCSRSSFTLPYVSICVVFSRTCSLSSRICSLHETSSRAPFTLHN